MQTRCVLACLHASLSRFLHYLCDNVGVVVVQACEGLGAVTVKQRRKINSIASALSLSTPDMDAMTFDDAEVWITHHSGAHARRLIVLSVCLCYVCLSYLCAATVGYRIRLADDCEGTDTFACCACFREVDVDASASQAYARAIHVLDTGCAPTLVLRRQVVLALGRWRARGTAESWHEPAKLCEL